MSRRCVSVESCSASQSAFFFFFFNDTATTEIYTLSLHDALPISARTARGCRSGATPRPRRRPGRDPNAAARAGPDGDRKSTRLNSSHDQISYAVFCLKKKKKTTHHDPRRANGTAPRACATGDEAS